MDEDITLKITAEEKNALEATLVEMNKSIERANQRIQMDKEDSLARSVEYLGPEPKELLTFQSLAQLRFTEAVNGDVRRQVRVVADTMAETYMAADPAKRAQMLQDLAKYREPATPPQRPTPPV